MESWRDSWESGSLVRYLLLSSIVHHIKKTTAKVLFTADLQVSLYFKGVFTNIGPGRLGWAGVGEGGDCFLSPLSYFM